MVAALSEDPDIGSFYVLVAVVVTMLIFWLAHVYAAAMARALEVGRHVGAEELGRLAIREWPLVQAAFPATIVLALGAVGILSRQTAEGVAIALGVVWLFLWGLAIGRRSRSSWPSAILQAAIGGGFGLVIVGLKALVH